MICRICGFENAEGSRFCTECGTAFEQENVQTAESTVNAEAGTSENMGAAYETYSDNVGAQTDGGAYYNQQNTENNQSYYGNAGYYQQPPYGGYSAPADSNRVATVKDYLKWMLLYPLLPCIPVVGFIIYLVLCIKNAFDSSFKARANFFKANLIVIAISVGVAILLCMIIFPILVFMTDSVATTLQDMDPSIFADGNFEYYLDMLIR